MRRSQHKEAQPRVRLLVFVDVARVIALTIMLVGYIMWLLH
jgi:hypothetical protein